MSFVFWGIRSRKQIKVLRDTEVNSLAEQQVLMWREFREHGIFSIHVNLAGRRSHMDACHRRGVSIRSTRPESLRDYNYHQSSLHKLHNILNEALLRR